MRPTQTRSTRRQLAVFVGGGPESLAIVEPVLDGRVYDVEFVASDDEPYAAIAAMRPDLVVVGLNLGDLSGFQLLTMLRLDRETARIPVLSYVRDEEVQALGTAEVEPNPLRMPDASTSATKVPN